MLLEPFTQDGETALALVTMEQSFYMLGKLEELRTQIAAEVWKNSAYQITLTTFLVQSDLDFQNIVLFMELSTNLYPVQIQMSSTTMYHVLCAMSLPELLLS